MASNTFDVGSSMQVLEACVERHHRCSPDDEAKGAVDSALSLLPAGQRELASLDTRYGTVIVARNCDRAVLVFPERALVTRKLKEKEGKVALRGLPRGVAFDDGNEQFCLGNEPTEILFSKGTFVAVEICRLAPPTQNGALRRHRSATEAVKAALAK